MRRFSPSALLNSLQACSALRAGAGALCVGYSGGLDSTVLLHAAARLATQSPGYRVRAIHVDHQLHPQSAQWRDHCERAARALAVEFVHLTVAVPRDRRIGLEAAAREARYEALKAALIPGEVLLTAHHADDQLETMLLALVRGAGVRGLSAVPSMRPFGRGWLARPLLEFDRSELEQWARAEGLRWIDDPSNENTGFDRNYIRHRVLPVLRERWPASAHSAARSAGHLAEASRVLDAVAEADAATVSVGSRLAVEPLKALEPARRRNVLRHWLRRCGARAPSTRKLAAIEHDMLVARGDRAPCVQWDAVELRRHGGLLYCMPQRSALDVAEGLDWNPQHPLVLPAGLGRLRVVDATEGICAAKLAHPLQVRFRAGGESLRPQGDAHRRKLKKLLQSSAVLPWWRERLPLVYCNDHLVAVGDLWIADEFAARGGERAVRIVWEGRPEIRSD